MRTLKISPKHFTFKKIVQSDEKRGKRIPDEVMESYVSGVICSSREGLLPALQKLKNTLMWKCHIQNYIAKKTLRYILARTDLWRQKFKIACEWRECHAGIRILQK